MQYLKIPNIINVFVRYYIWGGTVDWICHRCRNLRIDESVRINNNRFIASMYTTLPAIQGIDENKKSMIEEDKSVYSKWCRDWSTLNWKEDKEYHPKIHDDNKQIINKFDQNVMGNINITITDIDKLMMMNQQNKTRN